MTTIEYTKRTQGFESGVSYRNPAYFVKPEPCDAVVLDGDLPAIQSAYEKAGVPVSVKGGEAAPEPEASSEGDSEAAEREFLAAEYEERFGKAPHGKMKTSTLREKLEATEEGEE